MAIFHEGGGRTLALIAILAVLGGCDGSKASTSGANKPVPVRITTAHFQPIEDVARYAAVIRPRVETALGFRVAGKVLERDVDIGQEIKAGTVLARLDPSDLQLAVRAQEAQLSAARSAEANAKADYHRYEALRRGEWTTQQEFDRRKLVWETAAAQVREAEAQLRLSRNNAQYGILTADSDGVVTAVLAEAGQVVAQGQPIFRIAQQGEMEAVASIPEQKLANFAADHLTIELWSMLGTTIKGHLREMAATADQDTRTYLVKISLENPPKQVQLGMTATLTVEEHKGALACLLPLSALTKKDESPAVWALNGDGLILKPVSVAQYRGNQAVITEGVVEGDKIVTAGVHKLDGAMKVRAWSEPER